VGATRILDDRRRPVVPNGAPRWCAYCPACPVWAADALTIGRYGVLDRADVATAERAPHRADNLHLARFELCPARGPPPAFRSACGAGGADERRLEPAENRLAVLLQLAEAFGPVERELGGTHALEDLPIAV
jgi:hypothetical protein